MLSLQDIGKISILKNTLTKTEEQLKTELRGFSDASL